MRILMVSVFSNHFINWTSQLANSGHEIYWLDINDNRSKINRLPFVHQIVNWKRKLDFPGRERLKITAPAVSRLIEKINTRDFVEKFSELIEELRPDAVQSYEMHSACVPILEVMNKWPDIKWIYSSMGNDIFYFGRFSEKLSNIKKTLKRIDFMFADCHREYNLAVEHGFSGEFLGVFPTGGGYDLGYCASLIRSTQRKSIIIKGYQGIFGRCIPVVKALYLIANEVKDFKIIIFSDSKEVENYVKYSGIDDLLDIEFKGNLGRSEVMDLMGQSLIYIGNSISDGLPNTLLEAIIMETFPIQSNPGGATEEVLINNLNGLLIEDPESFQEIASLIKKAINDKKFLRDAVTYNSTKIRPKLDYEKIRKTVITKYKEIEIAAV